ncbi:MAG TPA: M56 family metallopeptidase [Chitinophagaceae bacterium]|nr:M56 family metallopeptidase [Chitinophagaceae bacterium]
MNLTDLQHSVFLQALGSAILNSLWQGLLLWLVYETTCVSYKNASSRFKNNLSTILLFASFIWFIISLSLRMASQSSLDSDLAGSMVAYNGIHHVSAFENFFSKIAASLPYLSAAYILLLLFLTIKLLKAYRYVYLISNQHLIAPPEALQEFASKVSAQLALTKKISIWISKHIDVPATVGFIKPVILIPVASLNNLSGEQLEAIILHELSHIRRNDFMTNILISVVETILFFNPFIALLSKAVKRERENCCDDFVLKYQYDPHSYATALLRLEQSRINSMKLALGAVSGKKQLLSRIKRITNDQVTSQQLNYGQKLIALLLVTGIICSIAWLSPADNTSAARNTTTNKELHIQPQKVPLPSSYENLQEAMREASSAKNQKISIAKKNLTSATANDLVNKVTDSLTEVFRNSGISNEWKDGFLAANSKLPKFVFDGKKFELPRSINLKNILPGNLNFTIDLSNIDVNKLNKELREAYKQINSVDWEKVQGDIREAFRQAKVNNFSSRGQVDQLMKNAQGYYKLIEDKANQLQLKKILEDQLKIQKQVQQHDSMLTTERLALLPANTDNSYNTFSNFYQVPSAGEPHMVYVNTSREEPQDNVIFISTPERNIASPYDKAGVTVRRAAKSARNIKRANSSFQLTLSSLPSFYKEETIVDL